LVVLEDPPELVAGAAVTGATAGAREVTEARKTATGVLHKPLAEIRRN